MSHTTNSFIEVDIVSGFLGAGKTTLIRQLIENRVYEDKLIVLENEFGSVNVDGKLLEETGTTVESIVASCICCSGADTLARKLNEIATEYTPRHLIIEPTGVARLSDLRRVFQYPGIRDIYRLNRVITVVDALNYPVWLKVSKEFFNNQIQFSDIICITKAEDCDSEQLACLLKIIKAINPDSPVFTGIQSLYTSWNNIYKKDKLFFVYTMQNADTENFETLSISSPTYFDIESLKALFEKIPEGLFGSVYRIKGNFRDRSGEYFAVNWIGNSYTLSKVEKFDLSETGISIIGTNLNRDCLKNEFERIKINR